MNQSTFVAGHLQGIMNMDEFGLVYKDIKRRIQHLSYLVSLMCSFENFDEFYSSYQTAQECLLRSNIDESHQSYFMMIEKSLSENMKEDSIGEELEMKYDIDNETINDSTDYFSEQEQNSTTTIQIKRTKRKYTFVNRKPKSDVKPVEKKRKERAKETKKRTYNMKKREKTDKLVQCPNCSFRSRSQRGLQKHSFQVHDQTLCSDCGVNFTDYSAFKEHVATHGPSYICDLCTESFRSQLILRNHQKKMHNIIKESQEERSVCTHCGIEVAKASMHQHLRQHTDALVQCPQCDFQTLPLYLKQHIKNKHITKTVTCDFCGKFTKNLSEHLRKSQCDIPVEERNTVRNYKCDQCDKAFLKSYSLSNHKRYQHNREPQQCEFCTFSSKHPFNMRLHVKRVHEKKPLKEVCSYCQKECTNLEWHVKTYHPAHQI